MNQETATSSSPVGNMLLTFLAGAAVGAVVLALVTPKRGSELRGDIQDFARRAKRKASDLSGIAFGRYDDMHERACNAGADLKRGAQDAMNDLGS
jgi:gas vesicle protein